MKINYAEYIRNTDASVLVAEAIFSELEITYPLKFVSEVAKTTSGGTPLRSNPDYYDGNIPWIKSGELNDGIIENAEEFITQKGLDNSSAKLHPPNTLLLAMYGATAGRIGKAKIAASTNQAVCALFPKEEIDQDYLFWFLRQYRHKFIEISKGGAQPNISQSVINLTKLPVPPKELQIELSELLFDLEANKNINISKVPIQFREKVNKVFTAKNNVFKLSDEIIHQLNLVKQLRQQLLQDAVQGKLVEQDLDDEPASILIQNIKVEKEQLLKNKKIKQGKLQEAEIQNNLFFNVPNNWEWCNLDNICFNITDGTHQTPVYTKIGRVFLSAQNVKPFKFMPENHKLVSEEAYLDYTKSIKAQKGDLLIARVGAGIGETAVIDMEIDFCFYVSLALVQPFKQYLNSDYLACVFNSNYGVRYSKGNISSKGGSAGNFNLGRIRSFPVPLPPIAEQHRIIEKLNQLMKIADALEANIKRSQKQNDQLLQQVLREALTTGVEPEEVT